MLDPCDPPQSITPPTLEDKTYYPLDTNFPTYTIGEFQIDPVFCEFDVTYSTSPLSNPIIGAPNTAITQGTGANVRDFDVEYLQEIDPISQTQTTTVTATSKTLYTQNNSAETATATWVLNFADPCASADKITITDPGQTNPDAFNYDGSTKAFNYAQHTYSPDWCDFSVSCARVEGPSSYLDCTNNDLVPDSSTSWTFDGNDYQAGLTPGEYTYYYTVTVGAKTIEFPVVLTVNDPCVAPNVQITKPTEETIEYFITNPD